MDIDEILAKNGDLTDEEFAFLEQNLLEMSRLLVQEIGKIAEQVADEEPELARKIESHAASVLLNVEAAVNIDKPQIEH